MSYPRSAGKVAGTGGLVSKYSNSFPSILPGERQEGLDDGLISVPTLLTRQDF